MQLYDLCLNAKKPAIAGGFARTTRGGDFELDIGQDISTGWLSQPQRHHRRALPAGELDLPQPHLGSRRRAGAARKTRETLSGTVKAARRGSMRGRRD